MVQGYFLFQLHSAPIAFVHFKVGSSSNLRHKPANSKKLFIKTVLFPCFTQISANGSPISFGSQGWDSEMFHPKLGLVEEKLWCYYYYYTYNYDYDTTTTPTTFTSDYKKEVHLFRLYDSELS